MLGWLLAKSSEFFGFYLFFPSFKKLHFFCYSNQEKGDYKGEFLSFLILIELRWEEFVGILSNIRFEAAHLAIWCSQKLVHLKDFEAKQPQADIWNGGAVAQFLKKMRILAGYNGDESPSIKKHEAIRSSHTVKQ